MDKPNAENHNPDPNYLRSLVEGAGLSQRQAAQKCGVSDRAMRYYLAGQRDAPYAVQYCLENL